jgi:hypothetical protein
VLQTQLKKVENKIKEADAILADVKKEQAKVTALHKKLQSVEVRWLILFHICSSELTFTPL